MVYSCSAVLLLGDHGQNTFLLDLVQQAICRQDWPKEGRFLLLFFSRAIDIVAHSVLLIHTSAVPPFAPSLFRTVLALDKAVPDCLHHTEYEGVHASTPRPGVLSWGVSVPCFEPHQGKPTSTFADSFQRQDVAYRW